MPKRYRVSLLTFLVCAVVCGSVIGLLAKVIINPQPTYTSQAGRADTYDWEAKWRVNGSREELLYVVFFPEYVDLAVMSHNFVGGSVIGSDIECMPEGLFVDGVRIETTKMRRVFVFTEERQMRLIELTQDELQLLSSNKIDSLQSTDLWKQKILPIVIEEKGELVPVE